MHAEQFDLVYCEGWDAAAHAIAGPIPSSEARRRDTAGSQYAVLVFAGGTPRVLVEVAWRHHSCVVWRFDDQARRVLKRDFRRVSAEQMQLVEEIEWAYAEPSQPEFGTDVPRRVVQTRSGGDVLVTTDQGQTTMDVPLSTLTRDVPPFGDWRFLLFADDVKGKAVNAEASPADDPFALLAELSTATNVWRMEPVLPQRASGVRLVERFPPPADVAATSATGPTWSPPQPMRPDPRVLELTGPPQPMLLRGERLVVESHVAGHLRLPTGEVVACAPDDYFLAKRMPYTVTVQPGTYEFVLRVARGTETLSMDPRVAAAGIVVSEERPVSWELAVLPGEDPRLLRDGDAYCFSVEGGMACFMDAAAIRGLVAMYRENDDPLQESQVAGVRVAIADEQESGANVVAFASGWGDGCYPVWLGRTAGGDVACFVADMRLFAE